MGRRGREALATVEALRGLPAPDSDDPRIDLAEAAVRASQSDYPGAIEAADDAILVIDDSDCGVAVEAHSLSDVKSLFR